MKKLVILFCFRVFLFASCDKEAIKETIIESGNMGNLTWKLTNDSTLIISGKGEMMNYGYYDVNLGHLDDNDSPMPLWWENRSSITGVVIENGVTSIGEAIFSDCSGLKFVTIPNTVTLINAAAFRGCSGLAEVTIPKSVTFIGWHAFAGCTGLTTVNFNAVNCTFMGDPGTSMLGSRYAFGGNSNITTVNIGSEVTIIPDHAFALLYGLTSINIPNSVTSVGSMAFYNCRDLTEVNIGNSVEIIGDMAFGGGFIGLTSINVDAANSAFSSDNGVLFNKTKTTLVQYPIGNTGAYTIPNSVTIIGNNAFAGCRGLTEVTIGNSVEIIGELAFAGCNLTSVIIPISVMSFGRRAFACYGLTSVTIGSSVTSIGFEAFDVGDSLTEIINLATTPQTINEYTFYYIWYNTTVVTLHVPAASVDAYKTATGWKDFVNIVAIE